MKYQGSNDLNSVPAGRSPPRIAVVGGGISGLTCARELRLRGFDPVVFEAGDRLGGRCSSRATRIGLFDDGAQCIGGATRLSAYAVQRPGELAALHSWTLPSTPAEEERRGGAWAKDEDEADVTRTMKLMGAVGVPSMLALANALARPLDVRLRTPIQKARRQGSMWTLRGSEGEIDEDFQALVLAIPAPLALPLALESCELAEALRAVRYRSRWVLLLGSERPVGLPAYLELEGSPIERIAAMHCKPGRTASAPQRWFVEADARWSVQHEHDDPETVADLLLENFQEHAGCAVLPNFLCAHQWRHAFVDNPAAAPTRTECMWDGKVQLGVCGDSVVPSRVDCVHGSGVAMARAVADGLAFRPEGSDRGTLDASRARQLEAHE